VLQSNLYDMAVSTYTMAELILDTLETAGCDPCGTRKKKILFQANRLKAEVIWSFYRLVNKEFDVFAYIVQLVGLSVRNGSNKLIILFTISMVAANANKTP